MKRSVKFISLFFLIIFVIFFLPFWDSLLLAAVFSLVIHPLLCKINHSRIMNWKLVVASVVTTTLLILTPFAVGIYSATSRVVELSSDPDTLKIFKGKGFDQMIEQNIKKFEEALDFTIPGKDKALVTKITEGIGAFVLGFSTSFVTSLPNFVVKVFIFTLCLYLFLFYAANIKKLLVKFNYLQLKDLNELIEVLQKSSTQTLVSLLIVGTIQATILASSSLIAGFDEILIIFVITFISSFIPVVGTAPIAVTLAAIKFFQHDWKYGAFLSVMAIVAGSIDNIVTPMLVKRGIAMDGAISLITIIGAIILLGIPGIFLGPIIGACAVYYFKKLEANQDEINQQKKENPLL